MSPRPNHTSNPFRQSDVGLSIKTGLAWWDLRRNLLGRGDGPYQAENLPDGLLRYSKLFDRDDLLDILGLGKQVLPEVTLKIDLKRSITRVKLGDRSFILKKYHRLHRCMLFSPDRKGWLGAHRLNNDVACHAWYRRHDLSYAVIVYADAGDLDLYMPQCLASPPELLNELFRQVGTMIAQLHRQNIFHADTKPGNFVYDGKTIPAQVKLIDTDDVRTYWRISKRLKVRNLAQFIGCTRPEFSETYLPALLAFFQGYLQQYPTSPAELLRLFPALRNATAALYPKREPLNQQLFAQLQEHSSALPQ
jgi:serine/threonine protein kinase